MIEFVRQINNQKSLVPHHEPAMPFPPLRWFQVAASTVAATFLSISFGLSQEPAPSDKPAPTDTPAAQASKPEPSTAKSDEVVKKQASSTTEEKPKLQKQEENKPSSKKEEPAENEPLKPAASEKSEKDSKPNDKKPGKSPTKAPAPEKVPLEKIGSNTNSFIPGLPWRIHDIKRPRPKAVQPGKIDSAPPADARVLFDGKDLSEWYHPGAGLGQEDEAYVPQWKIRDGYFEIEPRTGSILTIDSFGSCQLHIEWMIPEGTTGSGQGRGNSGIKLMERYEVQVLDSFKNRTYADGQAGAVYGQYPPMVNASREQGQWQTYEIFFEAPKYEGNKMAKPPYVTVVHNGILVQNHTALTGPTGLRGSSNEPVPPAAPLMLQDHNNRIRFRNIWIRELP